LAEAGLGFPSYVGLDNAEDEGDMDSILERSVLSRNDTTVQIVQFWELFAVSLIEML
jgi:hypothetical protein